MKSQQTIVYFALLALGLAACSSDMDELQQQITDLHKELHTVATRVADLEQAATQKTGATAQPDAAPRGSRARKAPGE